MEENERKSREAVKKVQEAIDSDLSKDEIVEIVKEVIEDMNNDAIIGSIKSGELTKSLIRFAKASGAVDAEKCIRDMDVINETEKILIKEAEKRGIDESEYSLESGFDDPLLDEIVEKLADEDSKREMQASGRIRDGFYDDDLSVDEFKEILEDEKKFLSTPVIDMNLSEAFNQRLGIVKAINGGDDDESLYLMLGKVDSIIEVMTDEIDVRNFHEAVGVEVA